MLDLYCLGIQYTDPWPSSMYMGRLVTKSYGLYMMEFSRKNGILAWHDESLWAASDKVIR